MEQESHQPRDLDEALADISLRFLVNLPEKEPPTVERLFFQIQQAHWYVTTPLLVSFRLTMTMEPAAVQVL